MKGRGWSCIQQCVRAVIAEWCYPRSLSTLQVVHTECRSDGLIVKHTTRCCSRRMVTRLVSTATKKASREPARGLVVDDDVIGRHSNQLNNFERMAYNNFSDGRAILHQ